MKHSSSHARRHSQPGRRPEGTAGVSNRENRREGRHGPSRDAGAVRHSIHEVEIERGRAACSPTGDRVIHIGARLIVLVVAMMAAGRAAGDEPVVTTLADFEDNSVATRISDVDNVSLVDCNARYAAIPARGQRSLMIEIGATEPDASAACDLRYRVSTPFHQANRVAVYAWLKRGAAEVWFRVRDATGATFETPPMAVTSHNHWVRLVADLTDKRLRRVAGAGGEEASARPQWPIEVQGFHIRTHSVGRQTIYLDDLEVEHRADGPAVLRGVFDLENHTHVYEPGDVVHAAVLLENRSQRRALPLTVNLAWRRADGTTLTTSQSSLNLPARGGDFRSRQPVDFSMRINEPGLYHLVARVQGTGWIAPAVYETTIAVTYSNRALPRGRDTFFGVRTNLLREPSLDQLLEVLIAREIGVQLLAIDTPWQTIEPEESTFRFAPLEKLINRVVKRDIAVMLVLTEPPAELAGNPDRFWSRQNALVEELVRRFGKRISCFQLTTPDAAADGTPSRTDLEHVARIQKHIATVQVETEVLAPAALISSERATRTSELTPEQLRRMPFATSGDSEAALSALEAFARQNKFKWNTAQRWFHVAPPLPGSGDLFDAVAVLRHYVRAAADGVGGVVWFDLRDDTNDPAHLESMRGLVQRDFSPKTPLLGFANTVGMLNGLLYAGEFSGTPPEFDSALFIGGTRQVAVLFPKPNRILPGVIAPYHMVEFGELAVFDFARREQPLIQTAISPLVRTMHTPFFIMLESQRAQSEPKLALAHPWLRVPETVLCGEQATFKVEIDALLDLRHSYLQLKLPTGLPLKSSLSSRAVRAAAGDTISFDITLSRTGDPLPVSTTLILRVSIEGRPFEIPIVLRPLSAVNAIKASETIADSRFRLGNLTVDDGGVSIDRAVALHAGFERRKLRIGLILPANTPTGATLEFGIALEGADAHAEARIEHLADTATPHPINGSARSQLRGWRCRKLERLPNGRLPVELTIPARSFGLRAFSPGTRLLAAAKYVEPAAVQHAPPFVIEWGSGLGSGRSTTAYRWIELHKSR